MPGFYLNLLEPLQLLIKQYFPLFRLSLFSLSSFGRRHLNAPIFRVDHPPHQCRSSLPASNWFIPSSCLGTIRACFMPKKTTSMLYSPFIPSVLISPKAPTPQQWKQWELSTVKNTDISSIKLFCHRQFDI